jgi:hypothetical protein
LRIKEIDTDISASKAQLAANENAAIDTRDQQIALLKSIISKMNDLYAAIDPDGNIVYDSLFTSKNVVYSGSDETVFHLIKLFALQAVLGHDLPIVIDSFRAEDLSTGKEHVVIELAKAIPNQIIFTTTLKAEEFGKYDSIEGVHHIDYSSHTPSKILSSYFVSSFRELLKELAVEF